MGVRLLESFCVAFSYTISGFLVRAQWMLNFDVYNVRMRMRMRQAPTPTRHSRTQQLPTTTTTTDERNYRIECKCALPLSLLLRRCLRERVKRLFKCFMLCLAKCYCCLNYFVLFMLFIPKYFLCARQNNKKHTHTHKREHEKLCCCCWIWRLLYGEFHISIFGRRIDPLVCSLCSFLI